MALSTTKKDVIFPFTISLIIAILLTLLIFFDLTTEASILVLFIFLVILPALAIIIYQIYDRKKLPTAKSQRFSRFFIFLDLITHELIPNRMSIMIILLLLGLFLGLEQAQELLLHLADSQWQPPLFYAILLSLALVCWYWARFMYLQNIKIVTFKELFTAEYKAHLVHDNPNVVHVRGMLPKLMGLIVLLIPPVFILKLYLSNISVQSEMLVIIATGFMIWILAIIIYAFAKVSFYQAIKDWLMARKWVILGIIVLLLGITTFLLFFVANMNSPRKIPILYLSGIVTAIVYFLITSIEVEKLVSFNLLKKTNRISSLIFINVILISSLFILFNIFPIKSNINGMTILLAGLTFYSLIGGFMIILGGKKKIPFLTLLIIIGVTISWKFTPKHGLHDVRLTEGKSVYEVDKRLEINEYIAKWFDAKADLIQKYKTAGKKFPIVFISSEGGGSRAALWTLLVHDQLEHTVANYYDHIFSMSGASGGNTGNSFYLAFQEIRDPSNPMDIGNLAQNIFKTDFVSSDVGLLFGRDAWQSVFCSSWFDDRSELLQQKWEYAFGRANAEDYTEKINPLKREFLSFWYKPGQPNMKEAIQFKHPLFLLSTTHVQSGDHATLAAVKIENFIPQNMDLLDQVYANHQKRSIPLSSGALMNARFPIVNPSGRIDGVGNFIDAGYYDNFGASETRAAVNAVIAYISRNLNKDDFEVVHFAFRNGVPNIKENRYTAVRVNKKDCRCHKCYTMEPYKTYKPANEAIVPVLGLSGAAFAHPNRELAEIEFIADKAFYFDLKRTAIPLDPSHPNYKVTPIIPLSRFLSNLAIVSMDSCVHNVMRDQKAELQKIFIYE